MSKPGNGANLDFECQVWASADKLRGHIAAQIVMEQAKVLCRERIA